MDLDATGDTARADRAFQEFLATLGHPAGGDRPRAHRPRGTSPGGTAGAGAATGP